MCPLFCSLKYVNPNQHILSRHPKVRCVANLELRTEEKAYHIQVLGLTQKRIYGPFFFLLLKQQSRQHRTWTCLSNSCSSNCLPTIFWVWWCFNRTTPYRTLRTLCVINLNETFPGLLIGRGSQRFWAARSRDLTPLDFFA